MVTIIDILIVIIIAGLSGGFLYRHIKRIVTGEKSKCSSCNAGCPFNPNQKNIEELSSELEN